MDIKFKYNKTELQELTKQLRIRRTALPTIKHKESALRLEVGQARRRASELQLQIEKTLQHIDYMASLWSEFDFSLLKIKDVEMRIKNIAGVKTPVLKEVKLEEIKIDLFDQPAWYPDGLLILKKLAFQSVEQAFFAHKAELLDKARKKTTQKVNLYEKVQIPGYKEAIAKIKRFLEDQEVLAKAAQKILKNKKMRLQA
jgi:V/A-type H+/Na+-transporting ATPase subunit D